MVLEVINQAAMAYRDKIPEDCWHQPFMPIEYLESEMRDGVGFFGFAIGPCLLGVMGIQEREGATLIRHAYVLPREQGKGIGYRLLEHLLQLAKSPNILVGTWKSNDQAIRFYKKAGFKELSHDKSMELLDRYWDLNKVHCEASIVLELAKEESRKEHNELGGHSCNRYSHHQYRVRV